MKFIQNALSSLNECFYAVSYFNTFFSHFSSWMQDLIDIFGAERLLTIEEMYGLQNFGKRTLDASQDPMEKEIAISRNAQVTVKAKHYL